MIESSKALPPWREAVKWAAVDAIREWEQFYGREWQPITGPVTVSMNFGFTRPASHMGTGRNAGRIRPSAPTRPTAPPDLSKLVRATEDALTDAGVWRDDALVVGLNATKQYADRPGATIGLHIMEPKRRPV